MRAVVAGAITAVLFVAGCGGDDDGAGKKPSPARRPAAAKVPAKLVGVYTTRLRSRDLPPDPSPDLAGGGPLWKITIANSGGIDNGPTLGIASVEQGGLRSPKLTVRGDEILLTQEECATPSGDHVFVTSRYRWKLRGRRLTLKALTHACRDRVAETILTARPLTRAGI